MLFLKRISLSFILTCACVTANSGLPKLPQNIVEQFPKEFNVMVVQSGDLNGDKLIDYVVVLHKDTEKEIYQRTGKAPSRPLLIFAQKPDGTFSLIARNDNVVYRLDEGGQCDPFLDSGEGIVLKGRFFTVENGVACGAHWTDYITFKYSEKFHNWIFHKRIYENWVMNSSTKPNADALVLGAKKVTMAKQNAPLLFQEFKRD